MLRLCCAVLPGDWQRVPGHVIDICGMCRMGRMCRMCRMCRFPGPPKSRQRNGSFHYPSLHSPLRLNEKLPLNWKEHLQYPTSSHPKLCQVGTGFAPKSRHIESVHAWGQFLGPEQLERKHQIWPCYEPVQSVQQVRIFYDLGCERVAEGQGTVQTLYSRVLKSFQ